VIQQSTTQRSERFSRIGLIKILDLESSSTVKSGFQMFQLVKLGLLTIDVGNNVKMVHELLG